MRVLVKHGPNTGRCRPRTDPPWATTRRRPGAANAGKPGGRPAPVSVRTPRETLRSHADRARTAPQHPSPRPRTTRGPAHADRSRHHHPLREMIDAGGVEV